MATLLAFLTCIPSLVTVIGQLMTFINNISGNDPKAFLSKVGVALDQLNAAQTTAEKQDAAKAIASIIHSLPQ